MSYGNEDKTDLISTAQQCDSELAGQVMAELLSDPEWSTSDMFYDLADHYIAGSYDIRKGIDVACSILTGYHMNTIAQMILDRCDDSDIDDEGYDEDEW